MAIPFLSVKVGKKGKAQPHSDYIFRQGKYKNDPDKPPTKTQKNYEDLVYKSHGNMPKWAQDDPELFWRMSDEFERKNGSTYREHVISLPREFNDLKQHKALIEEWIEQEIGDKHAYQYAIHNPQALDGKENPHVHIMFSDRTHDGIERGADTYFKRYNSKHPERGGAKKANSGLKQSERKELLKEQRERFEVLLNKHLQLANSNERISMKSLSEQGITDREPVNFSMQAYRNNEFKQQQKDFYDMRERVDKFREYRELKLTALDFDIDKEIARFARKQEQKELEQQRAQQAIEEERRRLQEQAQQPKLHIDPPAPDSRLYLSSNLRSQFYNIYNFHNLYINEAESGELNMSDAVQEAEKFYDNVKLFQDTIINESFLVHSKGIVELKSVHEDVKELSDNFSKYLDKKINASVKDDYYVSQARERADAEIVKADRYINSADKRLNPQAQQAENTINNRFRP